MIWILCYLSLSMPLLALSILFNPHSPPTHPLLPPHPTPPLPLPIRIVPESAETEEGRLFLQLKRDPSRLDGDKR
jgi:hypothetical protein